MPTLTYICRRAVIAAVVAASLATASCTRPEIRITGSIRNADGATLLYRHSTDGIFDSQTLDTLRLDTDSTFTLTLPADGYEHIDFLLYGAKPLGGVISRGGDMQITIDSKAGRTLSIESHDAEAITAAYLLNDVASAVFDLRSRRGDKWNIAADTVAESVYGKLTEMAATLDRKIATANNELREKAAQSIRMQLLLAFQNQLMENTYRPTSSPAAKQEWLDGLRRMTDFCVIDHPQSTFSAAFCEVVENNAGIRYFIAGEPRPEGAESNMELLFGDYEQKLTGAARETAMAHILLGDASSENYDPHMPQLAERFSQMFPQSVWREKIERAVAENRAFNDAATPDDIHFRDVTTASSLQEILARYRGKVVFMDIWATWCGPCRASFAHVAPLQQYAAENDIVLLYLSIDRAEDEEKWRKMAVRYDLKGEHIIINDKFRKEIYETFGNDGALFIPHCAIFDKGGELRFRAAASPENMDQLKSQLQQAAQ